MQISYNNQQPSFKALVLGDGGKERLANMMGNRSSLDRTSISDYFNTKTMKHLIDSQKDNATADIYVSKDKIGYIRKDDKKIVEVTQKDASIYSNTFPFDLTKGEFMPDAPILNLTSSIVNDMDHKTIHAGERGDVDANMRLLDTWL